MWGISWDSGERRTLLQCVVAVLGAMCQGSLRLAGEGGARSQELQDLRQFGPVSPDRVIVRTLDGGPVGQQTLSKDLEAQGSNA